MDWIRLDENHGANVVERIYSSLIVLFTLLVFYWDIGELKINGA